MNDFDFYLNEKSVKKISPDLELAKSLINNAEKRFEKMKKLNLIEFNEIIFENVYDSLREIADAILATYGFKSYSHEASISFLKKLKIDSSIILEFDDFRYKRNSSKYYGKQISLASTKEIIGFYNNHSEQLIKLCKKKDNCIKK